MQSRLIKWRYLRCRTFDSRHPLCRYSTRGRSQAPLAPWGLRAPFFMGGFRAHAIGRPTILSISVAPIRLPITRTTSHPPHHIEHITCTTLHAACPIHLSQAPCLSDLPAQLLVRRSGQWCWGAFKPRAYGWGHNVQGAPATAWDQRASRPGIGRGGGKAGSDSAGLDSSVVPLVSFSRARSRSRSITKRRPSVTTTRTSVGRLLLPDSR